MSEETFEETFEKSIVKDEDGNEQGVKSDRFQHFTPIMTPDQEHYIMIATFDGGAPGNTEEYKEALEEKLQYLVTVAEYNYMEQTGNKYLPYKVVQPKDVPEAFSLALDRETDYGERTQVIIRAFQRDENGNYNPVQIDLAPEDDKDDEEEGV